MLTIATIKCEPCRKVGACVRTGECCHIREKVQIDAEQEAFLKQHVFVTSGVVYLYPFSRYTISISHEEAEFMRAEAQKRKLALKILPKKVLYDASHDRAIVFDWFVDHAVCPFLQGTNHCSIYASRPKICKDFPFRHLNNSQLAEIKTFITNHQLRLSNEPYEVVVKKARDSLTMQGIIAND